RRHLIHQSVPIAVAAKLVTSGGNRPYQSWKSFGNPPEHEKCRTNLMGIEDVQQALRVGDHSAWKVIPLPSGDFAFERRDVKVIFQVHGQRVDDGPAILHELSTTGCAFPPSTIARKLRYGVWTETAAENQPSRGSIIHWSISTEAPRCK